MKASEFLRPELVWTNTDDDNNLTVAGSAYELRMHTIMATPTFSDTVSRPVEQDCALHN